MMSGGDEKESFWFFQSLFEKSSKYASFDGLKGLLYAEFPLYW